MTRKKALEEFTEHIEHPGSVEIARDIIEKQLAWLSWVSEREFSPSEHIKLLKAFRQLYAVVRPLTEKYID